MTTFPDFIQVILKIFDVHREFPAKINVTVFSVALDVHEPVVLFGEVIDHEKIDLTFFRYDPPGIPVFFHVGLRLDRTGSYFKARFPEEASGKLHDLTEVAITGKEDKGSSGLL